MKYAILLLGLLATLSAQPAFEHRVLQSVESMLESGRVPFSELYNDPRFSPEERAFLGRLYEVFFQIPGFLKRELEITGNVPSRDHIASSFGLSRPSIELLLRVMEADRRMPRLFTRSGADSEIEQLHLDQIESFIKARGALVRLLDWEGQPVPEFELETFEGRRIRSSDLKGSPSLLYFWFTGCPPCVRMAPTLAELERKYAPAGFRILGMNADRVLELGISDEQRRRQHRAHGGTFPNAHLEPAAWKAFGNVNVFPTLFFLRPDGTIHRHLINYQDETSLETIISELLQEG